MISSAVVIPEQTSSTRSPSPSLKRRQSSFTSDSNKRPRLETRDSTDTGSRNDVPPSPQNAMSPPRRKSAVGAGAAEERKRGQRLFGALLGTLSGTGSKPAHKKRDEIAAKQRERVKKEVGEREEEIRRKKAELDRVRRAEQKTWDKESVRIQHRNMRAMAHCLQTKTEPRLYFKPWDLRSEEKETIEQQVREVEAVIRKETGADYVPPENGAHDSDGEGKTIPLPTKTNGNSELEDATMTEPDAEKGDDEPGSSKSEGDPYKGQPDALDAKSLPTQPEKAKEDDQGGDELVEGQEDDVIY